MAGDPSLDGPSGRRKRKVGRPAAVDSPGGGAVASSSQRRAAVDDAVVLLRGALEFRRRTGLLPRPSNMPALYESVRGSLRSPVSQDQAYNKLRHLRHRLSHPAASGHGSHDDLLYELAAELWSAGVEEKYKKEDNKRQKDNEVEEESKDAEMEGDADLDKKQGRNGDEQRGGPESYPYLVHAAVEHWKAHSLSNSSLEAGLKLLNPLKAKALEDRWKKLMEDEMKFQADWYKACRDIFALLNQSHQDLFKQVHSGGLCPKEASIKKMISILYRHSSLLSSMVMTPATNHSIPNAFQRFHPSLTSLTQRLIATKSKTRGGVLDKLQHLQSYGERTHHRGLIRLH